MPRPPRSSPPVPPAAPTLDDVARLAGVSRATASRALATPGNVKPQARAAVAKAVASLGYVRHAAARALAMQKSFLVGAIVPTLDNPIFARCLDALQRRLNEAGFTLLVATSGYAAVEELKSIHTLLERGVAGLMLVGRSRADATYALLERKQVRYCLTWSTDAAPSQICIGFDNGRAATQILNYLWDLGHRRFGMIAGITADNDRAAERLAAIQAALHARGGTLLATERRYAITESQDAVRFLLDRPDRPTALICGNDVQALGAMAGCAAIGLRVPRDVSITGFDDMDFARCTSPSLTTIHVDAAQIGDYAAQRLVAMIEGKATPGSVQLPLDLIVRGSTAPPP
jgi:LacI family transcriptional regulator